MSCENFSLSRSTKKWPFLNILLFLLLYNIRGSNKALDSPVESSVGWNTVRWNRERKIELPGQVTDGGEGQRAPVVALQIFLHHVRGLRVAEYPVLTAEAVVLIDNVIEAPVPVKDHQ